MFLDTTTKSLEIILGAAKTTTDMPVTVDYVDITSTTTTPGGSDTTSNGLTAATILAAPSASTQRKVNALSVYNADTTPQIVTVRLNNNTTLRQIVVLTLDVGDTLGWTDPQGWYVQDANGNRKTAASNLYTDTTSTLLGTASTKLPSLTCTQSSNALTVAAVSQYMDFRNATLTTGTPVTTSTGTPANLVIPATSNLGMLATTVSNRLVILEAYNAGTPVLCVVNIAGGNQLDETNLISPTTIGASSNTANVIYSAVACGASTPYRVIGFVDVVFTTGTGWGSPTLVQPCGGEALTAMSGLGYGQTWQAVTRTVGTTYYNTTGKPIFFAYCVVANAGSTVLQVTINGVLYITGQAQYGNTSAWGIIPAGASYVLSLSGSTVASYTTMSELR